MNLNLIRNAIINDPENAWATAQGWEPVYMAGPEARILIVGQAPGRLAQATGIPWNDPSGNNLRKWLDLPRETFYDTSKIALIPMDFYFQGSLMRGDVPPRKGFAEKWHPILLQAMPEVELKILVGHYAHAYYLGKKRKKTLAATVQNYQEYAPEYFPLVHPSPRNIMWQKTNPWFLEEVVPVLRETVIPILK